MNTAPRDGRPFTGRCMLLIMLGFFGTIIAVNLTMATFASRSWTGLVVRNSYVASQEFNGKAREARAQAALGWTSRLTIADGELRFSLEDASGRPVRLDAARAVIYHPVSGLGDLTLDLAPDGSRPGASAAIDLDDGAWIIEIAAEAGLANPYRDVRRVVMTNGTMR